MVVLYSSTTGELLAMIEADRMGQLRTGAASGLATRFMAREDASTVGIFGSGYQAETQLEAVCAVRSIERAVVYSRDKEKRERFASCMSERLRTQVEAANSPEDAADADVIITATTAREPLLRGEWLKAGCHLNAAGANSLARRELDDEVVRSAAIVVVDSRDQALREASDLISPLERGWLTLESIRELREVVSGARPGRTSAQEVTLFKSLGIGLEDVAAGALVYQKAIEQAAGTRVPFLEK
jgi:ornithine cyclodeaminase/alanine dehydrogenase-like protein (mu-crystallin family)